MSRNVNPDPHPSLRDAVDVTRFWGLVQKGNECWEWQGHQNKDGYGVFSWHGRRTPAHVLALSFSTGELKAEGLDTRHSCDNPPCVNPDHLKFGTRKENVQDMISRGRQSKPGQRLTDEDVKEIRERRASGARQKDLAEQYKITEAWVSGLVRGIKRPEAGGPVETERKYRYGK